MRGFSLVELSIVLVILGLLVGGILAGQSLIRAAELRSGGADLVKYKTAYHAFRDKYMAIPGDMTNATSFWGKDNAVCSGHSGTASATGTCNGNGNGIINWTTETSSAWFQLAQAGLVEGSFNNLQTNPVLANRNVPSGKMGGSAYTLVSAADLSETGGGNILTFGKDGSPFNTQYALLRPEEAWNMDTKMDDGAPTTGKMKSNWGGGAVSTSACRPTYALNVGISCYMIYSAD